MKKLSRTLIFFFFFLPLFASFFFLFKELFNISWDKAFFLSFWSNYVYSSLKITMVVALLGQLVAYIIVFFVGFSLYSLQNKKLEKVLSFFLSVPHLAYMIGVLFLISSTGFFARIFSLENFSGLDHDPLALSLAIALGFKESLFLLFVLLPKLYNEKLKKENIVSLTFGHNAFTSWQYVLWPQMIKSLRYSSWIVLAYSVSVVDLSMAIGPTNPPPFSVVLWEFFQNPGEISQAKSLLGSFVMIFQLIFLIILWESLLKINFFIIKKIFLYKNKKINLQWNPPTLFIFWFYITLLFLPFFILLLWSFGENWVYPNIFPASLTVKNIILSFVEIKEHLWTTGLLAFFSSLISVVLCLIWLEWDRLPYLGFADVLILLVPIFPMLPLLFGLQIYLKKMIFLNPFMSVLYVHIFFNFPFVFLILKNYFFDFDKRYKFISASLGKSSYDFFIKIRLPLLKKGIFTAFSIGFAVSIAQYLSTVMIGAGRVETMTTDMIVAVAGEKRKGMAIFGLLQMLLPLIFFLLPTMIEKKEKLS